MPRAARLKRRDYTKLGKPIPGKKGKRYTRDTLPVIDSATVAHKVKGLALDDVALVLQALRDRGSKFRLVFQTPKGDKRYPSRRGSTAPLDPEGMSDSEMRDWLFDSLKGAVYKPLYIMEME